MKIILVILLFISINNLKAQPDPFSGFDIGCYGGINYNSGNNIGGDFLLELKTGLMPSIELKASAGYLTTIEPFTDTVRTYSLNLILDSGYTAAKYNYESKVYDIFPVALGIRYTFLHNIFSPYISVDAVYNFINTFLDTSPPYAWHYNSFEEIPPEFKENKKSVDLPAHSFGMILGAGTSYQITSSLNFDIRYFFKYDNEIINTHHFILGIYF